MSKFLDLKFKAFGLDINDSSIKIARLGRNKKGPCIDSFAELKIGDGLITNGVVNKEDSLVKLIKAACAKVRGKKLGTKYVVCSLPEEESFLQVIQMPKMDEEELRSAISFEVENHIPLTTDQVYFDFQTITPTESSSDHCDVLIIAMAKKTVDIYLSCVKRAGLIPIALEIESQSISRALIKNEVCEQPVVILDIGQNNTDFVVFSGRSTRFTYSIPISSSQFTDAISKSLKTTPEKAERLKLKHGISENGKGEEKKVLMALWPILDEFVSNIKKHIDFYQEHALHEHLSSKKGVQKIILCGGGANLKGLPTFLSQRLGVIVEVGDPFINLGTGPRGGEVSKIDFPSFAACLGLAQRAVDCKEYEY